MTIFEDYYAKDGWTLTTINEAVVKEPKKFIGYVENSFKEEISKTVEHILERQPDCKILMLAGPSSSGKTTTANMIRDELRKKGVWSTVLSLDDFYVGVARLPLLENGEKDFESVNSLDIEQVRKSLKDIVFEGICDTPIYDFSKMAPSKKRRQIKVPENGLIIIEGLHALNPIMMQDLPEKSILKIYVSVIDSVLLDDGESLDPEYIRLTRRVIRDYNFRFTLPLQTMGMWGNVCRGEQLYIKPYKKDSDIFINSFHAYEVCVMAKEMSSFIDKISEGSKLYYIKKELSGKLPKFKNLSSDLVPRTSLLKEFLK